MGHDDASYGEYNPRPDSLRDLSRRFLVEFVGTFFLAWAVGLSNLSPFGAFVPGFTLMVIVFCFGHVSLGIFNPAISVALFMRRGLLSLKAFVLLVVSQLVGGVLGGLTAWGMGGGVVPGAQVSPSLAVVFFAEFLGTILLSSAVLNAGTSEDYEGNSFFGLAIGGTLLAMVPTVGSLSGAVFNPAVGMLALLGPVHEHGKIPSCTWVYFVAPPLAGALGALFFRFVSPKDHAPADHLMRGPSDHHHSHEHHHHDPEKQPLVN